METDSFNDQFQQPIEDKRRFFAFLIMFLFGMFFFALILQIFFDGSLSNAFGQKTYTQIEFINKEAELYNTYAKKNEEITQSLTNSQYVLEFAIMSYYIKGFADGNKGKGDNYFIKCVTKDKVLATSIVNHGVKYIKPEILSKVATGLLPANIQGELK